MPIEFQDAPKRRRLAAELTRRRHELGLSAREVARRLGWSQSKLAKFEVARTKPSAADVAEWAAALGVGASDRARLAALAEEVAVEARTWPGADAGSAGADLDARTEHLAVFQPAAVPSVLRTAAYDAAVASTSGWARPHGGGRPADRQEERPALLRGRSRRVEVIVTDAALRWSPGAAADHAAQLDRIASFAGLPSLSVAVLPSGAAGPPPFTPFAVRRLSDDDRVVEIETLTGTTYEGRRDRVEAYEAALGAYRSLALRGERARDAIHAVAADVRRPGRPPPRRPAR